MPDVAKFYGLQINRSGMACCPFREEKTSSLKVYDDHFYCFGCGATGDCTGFVAKLFGISQFEAAKKISYLIPSVVVGMCDTVLIQHKAAPLNMQKILKQLFVLNMIKVHWVLTDEVRYRPQKRVGKTRRRYITFYKKQLTKFFAKECLGE